MIHIVGAGPGDPELITVKGARLLKEADVVIYAGSLVNPALLDYCRKDCQIYDSASMTLEEVLEVMTQAEVAGKTTVRLHTGDPSVYGAIREQMDGLKRRQLSWTNTPGVSSFLGAAASLAVEYTLPGVSQSLILTRLAGRTPVPETEELEQLAQAKTSMAIFLSTASISLVAEKLIAGGYPAETPAALVYKATWPEEKILRSNLKDLPELVKKSGIDKTALILVGNFLGDDYDRSLLYHPSFSHGYRRGVEPIE